MSNTEDDDLDNLMQACYKNDKDHVKKAISMGIDINTNYMHGYTALHCAAEAGSIDVLKLLVKQPSIQLNIENHDGETPLSLAIAKCKNPKAIDVLIKAGADINALNDFCDSPLVLLVHSFTYKIRGASIPTMQEKARIIIERGYDGYIGNEADALEMAINLYQSILMPTQYDDWLNFVCMFLYYGADVNSLSATRNTAVRSAIKIECNELCALMVPYMNQFDSCLQLLLTHSKDFFEYVFTFCNHEMILSEVYFIDKFLSLGRFDKDQFVRNVNLIFEHDLVVDLFRNSNEERIHMLLINQFLRLGLPIDEQIKILYSLLIYCNQLTHMELSNIYNIWGYDKRFEVYMRIGIVVKNLKVFIQQQDIMLKCLCFPDLYRMEYETLPSLQALSRDCVRRNIRKDLIYDANSVVFKYYNYLLQLDVPVIVRDILTLKRLV